MSNGFVMVPRELLERYVSSVERHGYEFDGDQEIRAALDAPAEHQGEPVAYQFQDRDGKWCGFMNERHYQNTLADGTWPIRPLYTHADPGEIDGHMSGKCLDGGDCGVGGTCKWCPHDRAALERKA